MAESRTFKESDGILVMDKMGNRFMLFPLEHNYFVSRLNPIRSTLVSLGIPTNLKGFEYAIDVIEQLKEDPFAHKNLHRDVYPKIAKKYCISPRTLERDIIYLLDYCHRNKKYVELFGTLEKLTPKKFLTALAKLA